MIVMGRGAASALCAAILAAACTSGPQVSSPTPATATATPARTAAVATASTTPSPLPPTPKPAPVTSAKGEITVRTPLTGELVSTPVSVTGDASVFEATLRWRVVTSTGAVLAEGMTMASAGAPQRGTFKVDVNFTTLSYGEPGFVEVWEVSPRDGSISDIARVAVQIQGAY